MSDEQLSRVRLADHNPTGLIASILGVLPGLLIAGLVIVAYSFLTALGSRTSGTSWIPFLDGLGIIIWELIVPEILREFVALFASLWMTFLLFKSVNTDAVIYSTAAVWSVLFISLILILGWLSGFGSAHLAPTLNVIGFLCAAFYARANFKDASSL